MRKSFIIFSLVMALLLAFAMPALGVKIAPYSQPLHDIMHWDAKSNMLIIQNPENERQTVAWPATVDLWNYNGNYWVYDLPTGDKYAFDKEVLVGSAARGPLTFTFGEPLVEIYGTCASTSGTVNAMSLMVHTILTGEGQVGRAAEFVLAPDLIRMGAWGNAIKAKLDLSGDGVLGSIGLLAGVCAEVVTPAGQLWGSIAVSEHEIVATAGFIAGDFLYSANTLTFLQFALSGDGSAKTEVDNHGLFFTINGLTAGATNMLSTNYVTLKGSVNDEKQTFLVMSHTQNMIQFQNTTTNPAVMDGVGTTISVVGVLDGTATGHMAGLASWVNIADNATANIAGSYLAAVQTGIYEGAATEIANLKVIFGMRMHKLLTDTPNRACPFSLNTNNTGITAIFDVATRTDLSDDDDDAATYTADGWIPFFVDVGGNIRYIRTYR